MNTSLRTQALLLALSLGGFLPAFGTTPVDSKKAAAQHKSPSKTISKSASKPAAASKPNDKTHKANAGAKNAATATKATGKGDNVHTAATSIPSADFKLNAAIDTTTGNSATNTYGSLGAGDGAPAPVFFERKFDMLVAPKSKEEKPQVDVASAKKAAVDKTAELQAAEASKVDWSGWASQLADHWFSNLKNLEYNSHRGWTTDCPAMIQFTCHADGRITNIQLRQSCGNTAYDNMQIEALKRTIPCPSFPAGTHLNSYTLIQGWEAHPRHPGEQDYKPGSFGHNMPAERVPLKKPATK
jgi:TonB family protein